MKSEWNGVGGPLIPYDRCPHKKIAMRRHRDIGECYSMMKTEIGMCSYNLKTAKAQANYQKLEEAKKDFPAGLRESMFLTIP